MTGITEAAGALKAWVAALGRDHVVTDAAVLDHYARTTQDEGTQPLCVLNPANTGDVQEIVRIATEHQQVVYPISRGKNWGYGDACAPTEGAAIIDLQRMNHILEVNAELAYAVVEPGVSQGQLYDHLREHQTGLWMDSTGAGPEASLVGNTLDRGFGHTRYGDHFLTTCGMEIVLADGQVLNTGFGHYDQAKAARVYRYGVGPFLDGIFCQSNLGIVTKIGLWLMPEPEAFSLFFATVEREDQLAPLIDALRPLRLAGHLNSAIHIGNDLRVLSSRLHYPWDATGGRTPLPKSVREAVRRGEGIGAWSVGGSLAGTKEQVRGMRRRLKRVLKPLGKMMFVGDLKYSLGARVARWLHALGISKLHEQFASLRPVYLQMKGAPSAESVHGTQWRLRTPPEHDADGSSVADPLDTGCGLMWMSPVLPMTGRDAMKVLGLVEPIFERYEFELLATFTMLTERAMVGILNVAFDKAEPEETARAMECYDRCMEALIEAGYIPYRTGLRGMAKVRGTDDVFWDVARRIKEALDPGDIVSRGRYIGPLSPPE